MKLASPHYAILFLVARWSRVPSQCSPCRTEPKRNCPDCVALRRATPGLTLGQIRAEIDVEYRRALNATLTQLTSPIWHEHSPLLHVDRCHYVVSGRDDTDSEDGTQTGGWRVIADARSRQYYTTRQREWINRRRWPATESDAGIVCTDDGYDLAVPVAIPTGSTVHGHSDPERQGLRQIYEQVFGVAPEHLGELTMRDDLCQCLECARRKRFPWQPRTSYARDKSRRDGHDRYCKTCRAEMARERRARE